MQAAFHVRGLTRPVRSLARRVAGTLAAAVARGPAVAAVLQFRLGSLQGSYAANAAADAPAVAAVSLSLIGLESLLGHPGFGLDAAANCHMCDQTPYCHLSAAHPT
ncbi:hypothetical protein [Streptomyces toxytricini]|uniref:PD-(D/E)XK endonuclease-like domain-containing protein n=1 Tax=Streptomyces toxytricini TaxID=67369 RepID=A0ABW8EKZ2_STRT5